MASRGLCRRAFLLLAALAAVAGQEDCGSERAAVEDADGVVALLQAQTGRRTSPAARLEQLDGPVGESGLSQQAWEKCADEGHIVPVAERVRFGWAMSWVESTAAGGLPCVLSTFGADPIPGAGKVCECFRSGVPGALARVEMGLHWARCAGEGEMCECASGAVRFGNGVRWEFTDPVSSAQPTLAAPPTRCGPESFGGQDPVKGVKKECWCQQPHGEGPRAPARVAVVMLSRRPPSFKTWLEYHLNYMGVERVFMQVEDTPDFNATWGAIEPALQQRVEIWLWRGESQGAAADTRPADDFETLQARQMHAMQRAKDKSAKLGIEWLLHIDDDELLYTQPYRRIGDILAAMPVGLDQAFIGNVEAVFPSADVENCFFETKEINVNPGKFAAYANGKAAIRVANREAIPGGPHSWGHAEGKDIPSMWMDGQPFGSPVLVVHFESCPFSRWQDKFWELGNASPEELKRIPFPFYRESIRRMQTCRTNPSGSGGEGAGEAGAKLVECSVESLRDFWSSWKTKANPRLQPQDLVPLQVDWAALGGVR